MPSWKRRILQNLPCSRGATSKLQLMVVSNYCYSIWGHWLNSCQGLNFIWGFFSPSTKITAQLWIIATLDFQSKGLMKFVSLQIVKFACLVTSAHMQYHSSDTHQKYLECLLKHHILKEAQLMTWERSKTKIDKCGNTTDRKVCTVCIVIFDQQILVGKREKNFWRNNNARKEATCKEKCVKNGSVNETTDTTKRKGVLKDTYLFRCLFFCEDEKSITSIYGHFNLFNPKRNNHLLFQ